MAEHEFAANERWKFAEITWEVFKFYITLLTGTVGFVLALISLKMDSSNLLLVTSISSGIVFTIGILVFMRMIVIDLDLKRARTRLRIARTLIGMITSLDDYLTDLNQAEVDLASSQDVGYSMSGQLKRATAGIGLKIQVVVINCFVGTISIVACAVILGMASIINLILTGIIGYLVLIIFHALIAKTREKIIKSKGLLKEKST